MCSDQRKAESGGPGGVDVSQLVGTYVVKGAVLL
jgi:hypothetical protein